MLVSAKATEALANDLQLGFREEGEMCDPPKAFEATECINCRLWERKTAADPPNEHLEARPVLGASCNGCPSKQWVSQREEDGLRVEDAMVSSESQEIIPSHRLTVCLAQGIQRPGTGLLRRSVLCTAASLHQS